MKRDPLLWGALIAVLVVLASAEYDLARACGFGTYVAAGVPGALDIYAVKALRAKRDVTAAVIALILVNAASHLVSSDILPVSPGLVVAVSAIAPLVLWRVHRLSEEPVAPQKEATAAPVTMTIPVAWTPPRPPEAVPAGVRTLPLVAREVTTEDTPEVTIERIPAAPAPVVTRPAIETGWKALTWPPSLAPGDQSAKELVTTAVPAADPRQVVTVPVTITPSELRKQARALNRQVVRDTNRPVTTARLQEEYGLSRRDATDLRREIVGGGRS
ncbi:hypothetical protein OG233_14035 [Streptomyces sp. NBC_01218]|uniref:hypothetical protein n=1 Tax=Streptomyces sp. NBC_01218 TaxID=2903780 RepID=UPI002E0FD948|nr:hypothetical protein OG233_14035 [Streptomyces sp. NBC_01218]